VVKFSSNNSWRHEITKSLVCLYIQKVKGHDFICEGILLDNAGIVDVLDCQSFTAYEVMDSESEESIEEKRKKYPFDVVKVDAIPFVLEKVLGYLKDKLS
jgi:hypothetical protein